MQENRKEFDNTEHTLVIEGRNAVLEAFRSGYFFASFRYAFLIVPASAFLLTPSTS